MRKKKIQINKSSGSAGSCSSLDVCFFFFFFNFLIKKVSFFLGHIPTFLLSFIKNTLT